MSDESQNPLQRTTSFCLSPSVSGALPYSNGGCGTYTNEETVAVPIHDYPGRLAYEAWLQGPMPGILRMENHAYDVNYRLELLLPLMSAVLERAEQEPGRVSPVRDGGPPYPEYIAFVQALQGIVTDAHDKITALLEKHSEEPCN
jgi:hypothetical protein